MVIYVLGFKFVTKISGLQLKDCWNNYIDYYFVDETDNFRQTPWPVSEFLYWIEKNPELVFTILEPYEEKLSIH